MAGFSTEQTVCLAATSLLVGIRDLLDKMTLETTTATAGAKIGMEMMAVEYLLKLVKADIEHHVSIEAEPALPDANRRFGVLNG